MTSEKKLWKTKLEPTITEAAIKTALPFSPTPESHVSGSSEHNKNQFLTTPRQKNDLSSSIITSTVT
jgi:hypothetical protein